MNKQLKKELLVIGFILFYMGYAGRLLKLLDTPKVVEWPPRIDVVKAQEPSPTPTPVLEFTTDAEKYVYEVFGEHYKKAMLLLKGDDECGGENKTLNPYAVNDNTVWGGIGKDRGVFQINSVFHPLTDEQAFDYKQNIDYAYRMFKNDNYTFVRWTAGRCLGI